VKTVYPTKLLTTPLSLAPQLRAQCLGSSLVVLYFVAAVCNTDFFFKFEKVASLRWGAMDLKEQMEQVSKTRNTRKENITYTSK
jgi:hypothetical protein